MINIEFVKQKKLHQYLSNEIFVMQQIKCENCLKIYRYFTTQTDFCLVLEYCNAGNLLNHIWKKKPDENRCL